MIDVDVTPLHPEGAQTFISLYQLYRYDFSEFSGDDVDAGGYYLDERPQRYATDARFTPYLFRIEGQLAGFAVVRSTDAVDGSGPVTDMEQFFVMRKYRRRGVGEAAATTLFDRYPGRWQVRERDNNVPAQAFWRRIIDRYTGGALTELSTEDSPAGGPVQFFESGRSV